MYLNRKEHVDLMRSTQHMDEDQLKTLADSYDSVYIHPVSNCFIQTPMISRVERTTGNSV